MVNLLKRARKVFDWQCTNCTYEEIIDNRTSKPRIKVVRDGNYEQVKALKDLRKALLEPIAIPLILLLAWIINKIMKLIEIIWPLK